MSDNIPNDGEDCTIILFPELAALKKEVEKLRVEISILLSQRDELLYVECKNLEMSYMLTLGGLEYKAYELQCDVLRLKRKLELIRMRKNRGERVVLSTIESTLDEEFAEYKAKLDEQIGRMNEAIKRSKYEVLSREDSKELKKLYRSIVKALHPDLHPNSTEAQIELFRNAVTAYENGDLSRLRIIGAMVAEPPLPDSREDAVSALARERERLKILIRDIRDEIEKIKSEYPYTMKALLLDDEKVAEKKTELDGIISQLRDALEYYKQKITEALGR